MQELYEIEMIKQLKAKYCYYTDGYFADPTNFDRLMGEVFMEDTELDFGPFGKHSGREELEGFFRDFVWTTLSFCQHRVTNPIITILNKKEATGLWSFLVPCTFREDNSARWIGGTYDEKYEKRDGRWHIRKIRADFCFLTPFDKGWAKENLFPPRRNDP